jgi:PKD repeat protein
MKPPMTSPTSSRGYLSRGRQTRRSRTLGRPSNIAPHAPLAARPSPGLRVLLTGLQWSWDDGTPHTTGCAYFPQSHTFAARGSYDVEVTATGTGGFQLSGSESVTMGSPTGTSTPTPTPNGPTATPTPSGYTVGLSASATSAPVGITVIFTTTVNPSVLPSGYSIMILNVSDSKF